MKRVAVVGAGTMGHGIAQVAAFAGFETALTDANSEVLEPALEKIRENLSGGVKRGKYPEAAARAAEERLRLVPDLASAVGNADLVVEAIVENMDAKKFLFGKLARMTLPTTILATNTSSLSVRAIAESTPAAERVIGMHFFNPVHIMKLIEIVVHDRIAPAVLEQTRDAALRLGKDPIIVKDSPGFASSRLGVVLGLEAMRMVEQGVASASDIDKAMELGYGHPIGPLKVTDLVGLDVRLAIAEYLHREIGGPQYDPPAILRKKVADGDLGNKTGKGFHEWPKPTTS